MSKDIDNGNATENDTANKSTAFSNARRIIFLFFGLFFIGIGCSIIYNVGTEALIAGLLPLILGFILIKEVFAPNKKKKVGLLGKPGTFSRKANVGCLIILIPSICIFIWVGYANWKAMRLREIKALATSNLFSVLTACEEYWINNPAGICSLPTSRNEQLDWGLTPDKVEILVINGHEGSFKATAKHCESDTIFQIDNKGNVDINGTK